MQRKHRQENNSTEEKKESNAILMRLFAIDVANAYASNTQPTSLMIPLNVQTRATQLSSSAVHEKPFI